MADVITKDRSGEDETHTGVDIVELTDADGNSVEFYGESMFDNYYTKDQTYSADQINSAISQATLTGQSDWDCYDSGDNRYVRNRPIYDSRQNSISVVVDAESGNKIDFQGLKFHKISDKPLTSSTDWSVVDTDNLSTVKLMYSDTKVSLRTSSGKVYNLNWYFLLSAFMNALSENLPSGHVISAWAYCNEFDYTKDNGGQAYTDENEEFWIAFLFVRQGCKLTKNEDDTVISLDTGTYISWNDGGASDVVGATATIAYGALKKVPQKYLDMSGYYSKAEVDAIVREQVAAALQSVLPAFTSADNGKVLGIQNGKLTWVEITTASKDVTVEGSSAYIYDADSVVQEGNSLYLSDAVVEDETSVYLQSEAFETVEKTGNALYLA